MRLNKCETKYCRNDRAKGRRKCHKCRTREYKERHPVKYAFHVLKKNAKRRGKEFSLTFEQFSEFCHETKLLTKRGIWAESWTIDRIDEDRGYHIDNIQILTNSENVRKRREYDYLSKTVRVVKYQDPGSNDLDDLPF